MLDVVGEASLPEHVRRQRAVWGRRAADGPLAGDRGAARESQRRVLADAVDGDTTEPGCGTACESVWLARLGARVAGSPTLDWARGWPSEGIRQARTLADSRKAG